MSRRTDILNRISSERDRQLNMPGSEEDVCKNPNDFIAIAVSYLSEEARRFGHRPTQEDYEESLVKAAAVIVAALEVTPMMITRGALTGDIDPGAQTASDLLNKIKSFDSTENIGKITTDR